MHCAHSVPDFSMFNPGLRMLDQPYMTDLIEANSMGHKPDKVHIYSASWGPTDDGKTVDGPRNATMRAIVKGVNEVREGGQSECMVSMCIAAKHADRAPMWVDPGNYLLHCHI